MGIGPCREAQTKAKERTVEELRKPDEIQKDIEAEH